MFRPMAVQFGGEEKLRLVLAQDGERFLVGTDDNRGRWFTFDEDVTIATLYFDDDERWSRAYEREQPASVPHEH